MFLVSMHSVKFCFDPCTFKLINLILQNFKCEFSPSLMEDGLSI